jgi:hypothetical protein
MRDFFEVLDQVIALVPKDDVELNYFYGLIGELEVCKYDAGFNSPENRHFDWLKASDILNRYLGDETPNDKDTWQYSVYEKWILEGQS